MSKVKTFYSGGGNAATLVSQGDDVVGAHVHLVGGAVEIRNDPPIIKVGHDVKHARSEFDKILGNVNYVLQDSEYDSRYTAPPSVCYGGPSRLIRPVEAGVFAYDSSGIVSSRRHSFQKESLPVVWYNQDPNTSIEDSEYDSKYHRYPKDFLPAKPTRTDATESVPSIWGDSNVKMESEQHEKFRAFSKQELKNLASPIVSVETLMASPPQSAFDLVALREQFNSEMEHLYRRDLKNDYQTEYSSMSTPPITTADELKGVKDYSKGSEYYDSFRVTVDDLKKDHKPPAGIVTPPRQPLFETRLPGAHVSEYDAAFIPRSIERVRPFLPKSDDDIFGIPEIVRTNSPVPSKNRNKLTEYEEQYSCNPKKAKEDQRRPQSPSYVSQYNIAFDHAEDVVARHDDIGLPPHEHMNPVRVSEYNASYDHLADKVLEPKHIVEIKPKSSLGITEYEGIFCKYDISKGEELLQQEEQERQKVVLKPAYAGEPTKSHKHHLFRSEINPGYVVRSEYMDKFPSRKFKKPTEGNASRTTKTHDEMIANFSEKNLKWWSQKGKRLWRAFNPVTMNPRYNPFSNLRKTPKTEYQSKY